MKTGETRTDAVNNILELVKTKFPQNSDFNAYYGYAGASLWNWILIGLGHTTKQLAQKELKFWGQDIENTKFIFKMYKEGLDYQSKYIINNTKFTRNIEDYL